MKRQTSTEILRGDEGSKSTVLQTEQETTADACFPDFKN